jgi:hypothetical protein
MGSHQFTRTPALPVPAAVVAGRSRPVATSPGEDATGADCVHVERAAIVCHRRIAGSRRGKQWIAGMSG